MERYLKNEPKLTSYRKLENDLENPWNKFYLTDENSSNTECSSSCASPPHSTDSSLCMSSRKREADDKACEGLAKLNINDKMFSDNLSVYSFSSFSSASSAVSWDSNLSDHSGQLSPLDSKSKDPFALHLVASPGRTSTLPVNNSGCASPNSLTNPLGLPPLCSPGGGAGGVDGGPERPSSAPGFSLFSRADNNLHWPLPIRPHQPPRLPFSLPLGPPFLFLLLPLILLLLLQSLSLCTSENLRYFIK